MSTIDYACPPCGRMFALSELYYCHQCQCLKCKFCVVEEIDSYFCPSCLENLVSAEASMYQHRCKKCFCCPACSANLVFNTNGLGANEPKEGSTAPAPQIFLACPFCRWSTLNAPLHLSAASPSDLIVALNVKEKQLLADDPKVTAHVDQLKQQSREAARERKLRTRARRHTAPAPGSVRPAVVLRDLDELRSSEQRQLDFAGKACVQLDSPAPPSSTNPIAAAAAAASATTTAASASAPTPALALAPFVEPDTVRDSLAAAEISTLSQRTTGSELVRQSAQLSALLPPRHHLMTRRAKRCGTCDRLLIKPDLTPARIEFKRHHVAMLAVPSLAVGWDTAAQVGSALDKARSSAADAPPVQMRFVLVVRNPLVNQCMTVRLRPALLQSAPTDTVGDRAVQACCTAMSVVGNAEPIGLPPGELRLAYADMPTEQDAEYTALCQADDGAFVLARNANSVRLALTVSLSSGAHATADCDAVCVPLLLDVSYASAALTDQRTQCPVLLTLRK